MDARTLLGETPVLYAACYGTRKMFSKFLRLGANPFQKDARGRSIEDYINPQHPAWDTLQSFKQQHEAPKSTEKSLPLETYIVNLFRDLESKKPLHRLYTWSDHESYAILFLDTGRDEVTKILFESSLTRLYSGKVRSGKECNECKEEILKRPMHFCRSCFDYRLCHECFEKREKSEEPGKCPLEHGYLDYGGDEWWNLSEGVVNKENQTMEEWFEKLKADFLREYGGQT